MASRRKGPALFEVIRAAQQKQLDQQRKEQEAKTRGPSMMQNASALLGSPSYWLNKGKTVIINTGKSFTNHKPLPSTGKPMMQPVMREVKPVEETPAYAHTIEHDEVLPVQPAPVRAVAPAPAPVIAHKPAPVVERTPAPMYESAASAAARAVREEIAATSSHTDDEETIDSIFVEPKADDPIIDSITDIYPLPGEQPVERKRLNLKFNYTTGLVAGCLLLGAVAVGLIASNSKTKDPQVADGNVHPNALNITKQQQQAQTTFTSNPPITVTRDNNIKKTDDTVLGSTKKPQTDDVKLEQSKPIKAPTNVRRDVGKQYLVLLSFPHQEDADDLTKFFADNGVAVSTEKALPGYSKSWYSVLSVKGFDKDKTNSAEFASFKTNIIKLMEKYARGSKFKSFNPILYSWQNPTPAN